MADDLALRELPRELADAVSRELAPDERVLWVGQPAARQALLRSLPILLFGIPWTAFSLFWMGAAGGFVFSDGPSVPSDAGWGRYAFAAFGLPFVAIGVGMLSSPYWIARTLKRTVYLITSRRAMIIVAKRSTNVRTFQREVLQRIERIERKNGTGDLIIVPVQNSGSSRLPAVGFLGITEPRRVEELLRQVP